MIGVESCATCLEPYFLDQTNECLITPCYHLFHKECLLPWLKKSKTCPLCRDDVIAPVTLIDAIKEGVKGFGTVIKTYLAYAKIFCLYIALPVFLLHKILPHIVTASHLKVISVLFSTTLLVAAVAFAVFKFIETYSHPAQAQEIEYIPSTTPALVLSY